MCEDIVFLRKSSPGNFIVFRVNIFISSLAAVGTLNRAVFFDTNLEWRTAHIPLLET